VILYKHRRNISSKETRCGRAEYKIPTIPFFRKTFRGGKNLARSVHLHVQTHTLYQRYSAARRPATISHRSNRRPPTGPAACWIHKTDGKYFYFLVCEIPSTCIPADAFPVPLPPPIMTPKPRSHNAGFGAFEAWWGGGGDEGGGE